MKKLAFIPTREEKEYEICSFLKEAGFEVHLLVNKKSIFEAYANALSEHDVKKDDIVVMCHDDIQILSNHSVFNEILEANLSLEKAGFVGVAGTQLLQRSGVWWEGLNHGAPVSPMNPLHGCVYHGDSIHNMSPTYYGGFGRAVVMDGVFLAAKGSTLFSIGLSKPPYLKGNWDFYDILYTFKAFKKGLDNRVVPISILHKSHGMGIQQDSWKENREAFTQRFSDHLPASIP